MAKPKAVSAKDIIELMIIRVEELSSSDREYQNRVRESAAMPKSTAR